MLELGEERFPHGAGVECERVGERIKLGVVEPAE
jgi:hypothetical protein